MQKLFIILFTVFITINSAFCDLWSSITSAVCKSCPSTPVVQNFDINKFSGRWYEIYRAGYLPYESGLKCITSEYLPKSDGSINIFSRGYVMDTGILYGINGTAKYSDPAVKSKLKVTFKRINGLLSMTDSYSIIDTDYTSYSLVYSCDVSYCFYKSEKTWLLSRQNTLSTSISDRLKSTLQSFSSIGTKLTQTNQSC